MNVKNDKKNNDFRSMGSLGSNRRLHRPPPARNSKWALAKEARNLLPAESVASCHRGLLIERDGALVMASEIETAAGIQSHFHFKNVWRCGSVWQCPVCSTKISAYRGTELMEGINYWLGQGNSVAMLTLTVPHYNNQPLKEILDKISKARQKFKNSKTYLRIKSLISISGTVRNLEVTHGKNGWHVHTHELIFTVGSNGIMPQMLINDLEGAWQRACQSSGLGATNQHGLSWDKTTDARTASRYLTKWSASHELTAEGEKHGKNGNMTPWQLLEEYGKGSETAGKAFVEYATVFKGRKQLVWSKGLRNLLELGAELSDNEIAEAEIAEAVVLYKIEKHVWKYVWKNNLMGEILDIAVEGSTAIHEFLEYTFGGELPPIPTHETYKTAKQCRHLLFK